MITHTLNAQIDVVLWEKEQAASFSFRKQHYHLNTTLSAYMDNSLLKFSQT